MMDGTNLYTFSHVEIQFFPIFYEILFRDFSMDIFLYLLSFQGGFDHLIASTVVRRNSF